MLSPSEDEIHRLFFILTVIKYLEGTVDLPLLRFLWIY